MKQLKYYFILGTIFVIIVGTVAHFVYQWSGNNPIVGLFTPVNESTWEHMKLIFFPMLLITFAMNRKLKHDFPCITSSLIFGILLGTFLIPIIFYTYSGVLGYNLFVLDIATFIISVVVAFYVAYKLTLSCKVENCETTLTILLIIMAVCFVIFTYSPPYLGLFAISHT